MRYLAVAGPIVSRYGAEIVGDGVTALRAELGQSWDVVALLRYPNRSTFVDIIADPDCAVADPIRMPALGRGGTAAGQHHEILRAYALHGVSGTVRLKGRTIIALY